MAAEVESGGAQVREELSASQAAMAEELAAAQEQLMELKIEVAEVGGLREEERAARRRALLLLLPSLRCADMRYPTGYGGKESA